MSNALEDRAGRLFDLSDHYLQLADEFEGSTRDRLLRDSERALRQGEALLRQSKDEG